jgi:hypothetical protein
MQAKKAQQLLKARLARERQLYEMRKRAELRDAVAHLERPWDPDSSAADAAPNLLSVAADDQLKALSDRFHRPGGVDLWNDRDGPRVFDSPATGAASARFFPKNAAHSVQPYAIRGDAGALVTRSRAADVLLALGGQGVRENAPEEEANGSSDRVPSVEFTEMDGICQPLHASDDGDDSNGADWSSGDDDDDVTYESEGAGDVSSWREQPLVRGNGRDAAVKWEAAKLNAVSRDHGTGWSGDAFFSDADRARQGHLAQRWQQRNRGAQKRSGGRWNALDTAAGSGTSQRHRAVAGSISDSEMIQSGSQPKWRTRSKDGTRSGAGRWSGRSREDRTSDDFNSNSESARGGRFEPSWRAQNELKGRGNIRGRFKPRFNGNTSDGEAPGNIRGRFKQKFNGNTSDGETPGNIRGRFKPKSNVNTSDGEVPGGNIRGRFKPKSNVNTSDEEVPGRRMRSNNVDEHTRSNNGNGRYQSGGGSGEDLEAPTWKPRRTSQARNSNGSREDKLGGTFRRGDNGENPRNTYKGGERMMGWNGGRRSRGDDYSLRPTSHLHGS